MASPKERFFLAGTYFMEVMTIIQWEAAMEEGDRVDMELFGFLSFYDDATRSVDERNDQLLRAIERWGEINETALNPFSVWQAYLKTVVRLASLKDCRNETEVAEGNDEKSDHGEKRADVIEPDGQQPVWLPVDAGQPGVIGHGAPVSNSQWGETLESANV